jgi:hypothetical protein
MFECVFIFQASLKCERDLSNLTLSDQEQRELYEAAQIIQKAYRSYAGRKKASSSGEAPYEKEKEARAAIIIQNYYRRYKQVLAGTITLTSVFPSTDF